MTTPPRLASWVLSRALPPEDRDQVVGDLAEDFAEREAAEGRRAARRWYWRHAVGLSWTLGITPPDPHNTQRNRLMSFDDLRYALRRLAKHPAATLGSIVTLAVAIGAAVATWSLLSAVLLHPLAVRDADRWMVVGSRYVSDASRKVPDGPLSPDHIYPAFPAIRDSGIFEHVVAGGAWPTPVTTNGPVTPRTVFYATHDFFNELGLRLQAGRGFVPSDDQRGAPVVAILSDRLWRGEFGARPDVLGQTMLVGDTRITATIVGIAPRGFRGIDLTEAPDLYLPLHTIAEVVGPDFNAFADSDGRSSPTTWVRILGRLKRSANTADATAALAHLPPGPGVDHRIFGLTDIETAALAEAARPPMKAFARLLGATTALLLLIGCLTAGMLLLLRTEARRDEFAMCLAMGATRSRLAAGVVVEGALLSLAGAAAALPMSLWLLAGLRTFELPGRISMEQLEIIPDGRTLLVTVVAALLATLVMALTAGIFGFSANVADAIRARAGATPRVSRRRTRTVLVVAEIAVAMVLVSGAGLFVRSLLAALSLNPAFDTSRIATGSVSLRALDYTPEQATEFFAQLRNRLSANGTIVSAALRAPAGGMGPGGQLAIDGERRPVPSFVPYNPIDGGYFPTMGLTVTRGRNFTESDGATSQPVAIVSESFGRFIARGGDPIGHHIASSSTRRGQPPDQIEVVGVVPDIVTNVNVLEPLAMYRPLAQGFALPMRTVIVRAAPDQAGAAAIRETIATILAMEPRLAPPTFRTMDEDMARQMGPQRFGGAVLGALGGIAVILTLFGIYVLAESMSALRRREMGVRAALGATRAQLSRLILSETVRMVAGGIALGAVLSWFGARLIRSFLFQVEPFDAATIGAVVTGVLVLALAVSVRPALRAGRIDLARVLRDD
jgi:predicted permease